MSCMFSLMAVFITNVVSFFGKKEEGIISLSWWYVLEVAIETNNPML